MRVHITQEIQILFIEIDINFLNRRTLRYHIKYQYVGNLMKSEVEGIVSRLRLPLQKKLRFITQLSLAEVEAMNQSSVDPVAVITNDTNNTPQNNSTTSVPQ